MLDGEEEGTIDAHLDGIRRRRDDTQSHQHDPRRRGGFGVKHRRRDHLARREPDGRVLRRFDDDAVRGAEQGGERILAILGPGSVVGELSMIDDAPRSASVTALRDSKLSFVGRAAFEAFGQSRPELYRHVTTLLAQRLRDTNDALLATNFLSVKGRVARALLNLAEAFGRDLGQGRILIRQKVSQSDLAAMAGIARENVSRALNDWGNRSLVSRLAGYYCLENKAALNREAEGGVSRHS